jgi:hypothetical protein
MKSYPQVVILADSCGGNSLWTNGRLSTGVLWTNGRYCMDQRSIVHRLTPFGTTENPPALYKSYPEKDLLKKDARADALPDARDKRAP